MTRARLTLTAAALAVLACVVVPGAVLAKKPGGGGSDPDPAIAYIALKGLAGPLCVMNLDGSNKSELFSGECEFPTFSPDGLQSAFSFGSDDQGAGIYVIDVDGSAPHRVIANNSSWIGGGSSWSVTGWIAYSDAAADPSDEHDIFVVRPDGTGCRNLTNTPTEAEFHPCWNRTGDLLAVKVIHLDRTESVVLHTVEMVGGVPTLTGGTDITNVEGSPLAGAVAVGGPKFAHESDLIVLDAVLPGETVGSIWVLDPADPAEPRRVTASDSHGGQPCWSGDDTKIVFVGRAFNRGHIFSMNASDGSDLVMLTSRKQGGGHPACRP